MDATTQQTSRVAAVVWRWREPQKTAEPQSAADLRKRAAIQFLIAAVIAGVFFFGLKWQLMALVVLGVAGGLLVCGVAHPPLFAAIERTFKWFGTVVGTALTWILLVPFFCLVFVPGGLALRLRGRDPMRRKFPTKDSTYWIDYRRATGVGHHEKQYR